MAVLFVLVGILNCNVVNFFVADDEVSAVEDLDEDEVNDLEENLLTNILGKELCDDLKLLKINQVLMKDANSGFLVMFEFISLLLASCAMK